MNVNVKAGQKIQVTYNKPEGVKVYEGIVDGRVNPSADYIRIELTTVPEAAFRTFTKSKIVSITNM